MKYTNICVEGEKKDCSHLCLCVEYYWFWGFLGTIHNPHGSFLWLVLSPSLYLYFSPCLYVFLTFSWICCSMDLCSESLLELYSQEMCQSWVWWALLSLRTVEGVGWASQKMLYPESHSLSHCGWSHCWHLTMLQKDERCPAQGFAGSWMSSQCLT